MKFLYKQFEIDNSVYIFCAQDFEIFKINEKDNIENTLEEIDSKKVIPNLVKNNSTDFINHRSINTIGIDIINGCNLACEYCYISAYDKKKKKLSKEKFLDILNLLKKTKDNHIAFYFVGGGEPTLNFDLLKEIPSLCNENGFESCFFDITTNGTLLTQEMLNFFKVNKFLVHVSLDGPEEINKYRKYPNGKGCFKDVMNNIELLKENNIDFSCKTVVQPNNQNLAGTFLFFEENKIRFKFSMSTDSLDEHYMPKVDDLKIFEKQMDDVIHVYKKLIEDNQKIYALTIIEDLKKIHYGIVNKNGCGACKKCFYIDIDGDIFPCSYHSSSKDLSVGNIYKGIDYDKIIKNEFYAKPVDEYTACKNCWMKYLCSGSCFALKWLENKDTTQPSDYLCKSYDIYWSAIIKLYTMVFSSISSGKNVNFISLEKLMEN
ncbi:radical SAM protein [Culturomica massiliensis]|uniref:radical SAM protein n=1 Tax=Culturomica massiliensis TaxID=1841857 RepID=UPI003AB347D7